MTDPKDTKAEGTFWLPETPDLTLKGGLAYTLNLPDVRPMVHVYGEICKLDNTGFSKLPFVLGATQDGDVTLYNSEFAGSHTGYGYISQSLRPDFVFIGKHYNDGNQLTYDQATFSLYNATHWFNKSGFKRNYKEIPHTITFAPPSRIQFKIHEECDAHVDFLLSRSITARFEVGDYQYCKIIFKYTAYKHFEAILDDIAVFSQLVTFCTMQQTYAPNISLSKSDRDEQVRILRFDKFKIKPTEHLERQRTPSYNLVPFSAIESKFQELVIRWFKDHMSIKVKPVLILLLRIIRERPTLNIVTFLDATRALEVFHKNVLDRHRESSKTFKPKLERMLAKMDSDELNLFECVKGANNKDLKERIIDLVTDYLDPNEQVVEELTTCEVETTDSVLLNIKTIEQFAKVITDTRNYHTHYSERYEGKILESDDSLRQGTGKVVQLLVLCVMKYYNVSDIPRALRVLAVF